MATISFPFSQKLDAFCDANEYIRRLASGPMSQQVKSIGKELFANAPELADHFRQAYHFVFNAAIGAQMASSVLAELKYGLANASLKLSDQTMVEVARNQALMLIQAWITLKRSTDTSLYSRAKIASIESNIADMESLCERLGRMITDYNGKYKDLPEKKKPILTLAKMKYNELRTKFIATRYEINSLRLRIDSQMIELKQTEAQQRMCALQNFALSAISGYKAVKNSSEADGYKVVYFAGLTAANMSTIVAIQLAQADLQSLLGMIDKLEQRLGEIEMKKREFEQFLLENGVNID